MNIKLLLLLGASLTPFASAQANIGNQILLPNPFPVYVDNNHIVINHPVPGFIKKNLPTHNLYQGVRGCYIICYAHSKKQAVYAVSDTISVMGQIRLPGEYVGTNCVPT